MRSLLLPLSIAGLSFMVMPARATTVTIPDEFSTIQAGVDHLAGTFAPETVLVRSGVYPERVRLSECIVVMGIAEEGAPNPMPRIGGLEIIPGPKSYPGIWCIGLHIAGQAIAHHSDGPIDINFEACQFDSGLVDSRWPFYTDVSGMSLTRCTLFGVTQVNAWISRVDSCTFYGPLGVIADIQALVRWNRFEHVPGTAVSVRAVGVRAEVSHNLVLGGTHGVDAFCQDGEVVIEDNQIENCTGTGIIGQSHNVVKVLQNRVTGSQADGILVVGETVHIANNVVTNSGARGIVCSDAVGTVEGNVVDRCGGQGFLAYLDDYYGIYGTLVVSKNTSVQNAGDGFSVELHSVWDGESHIVLHNNVGYGNDGFGLLSTGPVAPTTSCNDWFANEAGSVSGLDPSPQDLAVDPGFCDVANGDVRLTADSPLLDAPGCGLIGARGQGCASTPTLLTFFTAERDAEGVLVRWQLADPAGVIQVWIERSDLATGPWTIVSTEQASVGGVRSVLDRSALAERDYWYRLVAREGIAAVVISEPASVLASVASRFELTRVTPNPGVGPLRISFTLASTAAVELDLLDLQGRHVAALARGSLAAGEHNVEWRGQSTAPGIYFLRYRYPGGHQVQRVVRLR